MCGFFSVIADEARDKSRVEQLSLCLRYVHPDSHCIVEHFVGFTACHKLDATSLWNAKCDINNTKL